MLEEIKSLSWNQTLGAIFAFLGLIAPGFLLLYLFKPELISSLETIKVLLFSLSLCMPLFVFNLAIAFTIEKHGEEDPFHVSAIALYMSSVAAYVAILFSYLANLTFKQFLLAILATEIIVLIAAFLPLARSKKK